MTEKQPAKILMLGWEFPPHISGGLGVACLGMTRALAERGHPITFVLPRVKQGMSNEAPVDLLGVNQFPVPSARPPAMGAMLAGISPGLSIHTIDSLLSPYMTEESYQLTRSVYQQRMAGERQGGERGDVPASVVGDVSGDYGPDLMAETLRYAAVVGEIAAGVEHDVIHCHDWLTMLAGIRARQVSGRPLVVHVHALEFDRSGEHVNQLVYDIEKHGMEQADRVVAVSHYTRDTIIRRYGIDPAKITVVHNAVDRSHSPVPLPAPRRNGRQRDKVVLFLGRITFQKGPDYFIEAAARVLKKKENVRFVMAGSGDMTRRMIERVAALKMGTRFHFTGFLRGAALERIFRESDVYVMPSVSEPFGISPLEAMYHDVPVIISRQSGVAEVLHHALKVDFWDVEALADRILALLNHGKLHEEIVRQGSKELKAIQWSNAAHHLHDVYNQARERSIQ